MILALGSDALHETCPTKKTVRLDVGIWFNETTAHIQLAAKDSFVSTVSADPASKRFHPNLYRKLADCLSGASVPGLGPDLVQA